MGSPIERKVLCNEKLFAKVQQIIIQQIGADADDVTPSADFVKDLGCDSLDTVELIMAFEEAFEIEIPDEDVETIRTAQQAVDYLRDQRVKA